MKAPTGKFSSLEVIIKEFEAAAAHLSLHEDLRSFIEEPPFSARLKLPVRMDDGTIKVFKAYHTIHSIARGPALGGVRCGPDLNLNMVEALALWSTHRCALLGIPFGGSFSAIECEPKKISRDEFERLSRRFVGELSLFIKPNNDVLAIGTGTDEQVMCWFMDTYSMHVSKHSPAIALGKPLDLGGSVFDVSPAAAGARTCIIKACLEKKVSLSSTKVAVHGLGLKGANICKILSDEGAKIVAISDENGAYCNRGGIDISAALQYLGEHHALDGMEKKVKVEKLKELKEIFVCDCDILVLAKDYSQIDEDQAGDVKAGIIAKAAHDPIAEAAEVKFISRGTFIIPELLCNSGDAAGRYLEWVQNRMGYYWPTERVNLEMQRIMEIAFDEVLKLSKKDAIPMGLAAAVIAVSRMARTAELRGVYA